MDKSKTYYVVTNQNDTQLCHCGEEQDAILMCSLGNGRKYKKVEIEDFVEVEKVYEY